MKKTPTPHTLAKKLEAEREFHELFGIGSAKAPASEIGEIVRFEASSDAGLLRKAFRIRRIVFMEGQDCPRQEEFDGLDDVAVHYLAYIGRRAAGTARYRETEEGVKLERYAVLEQYRGRGIGSALIRRSVRDGLRLNKPLYLHAQAHLTGLYLRHDFAVTGGKFTEVGIPHIRMEYRGSGQPD